MENVGNIILNIDCWEINNQKMLRRKKKLIHFEDFVKNISVSKRDLSILFSINDGKESLLIPPEIGLMINVIFFFKSVCFSKSRNSNKF